MDSRWSPRTSTQSDGSVEIPGDVQVTRPTRTAAEISRSGIYFIHATHATNAAAQIQDELCQGGDQHRQQGAAAMASRRDDRGRITASALAPDGSSLVGDTVTFHC